MRFGTIYAKIIVKTGGAVPLVKHNHPTQEKFYDFGTFLCSILTLCLTAHADFVFNFSLPTNYPGSQGSGTTVTEVTEWYHTLQGDADQTNQSVSIIPDADSGAITLYYGKINAGINSSNQAVTFTNLTSTLVRADGSGWTDVAVLGKQPILEKGSTTGYIYSNLWNLGTGEGYEYITLNIGDMLTFNFNYTENVNGAKGVTFYGYQQNSGPVGGNTPEPATMLMAGLGFLGLAAVRSRRKK